MVDPDRYNMASDTPHPGVAGDSGGYYTVECPRGRFVNGVPEADRLEAALDGALLASAEWSRRHRRRNRLMHPGDSVDIRVRMEHMYPWIGGLTKHGVAELFRGSVMRRYAEAGWADMSVRWDYQQSREMTFRFGISEPAGRLFLGGAAFRVDRSYLEATDRSGTTTTIWRGDFARTLLWLARRDGRLMPEEIDGIGKEELRDGLHALVCALDAESMTSRPGWLRATLDDLRVSAKLRGFDIDMTRRDGLGPGDLGDDGPDDDDDDDDDGCGQNGYCPPFEGSPDDCGFG